MKKRGQMEMSFGMIFSIILIIAFISFAFFAIYKFIDFQNDAKAGRFYDDFQSDIDRIWRSSVSSEQKEYSVPGYADFVCFVDEQLWNFFWLNWIIPSCIILNRFAYEALLMQINNKSIYCSAGK